MLWRHPVLLNGLYVVTTIVFHKQAEKKVWAWRQDQEHSPARNQGMLVEDPFTEQVSFPLIKSMKTMGKGSERGARILSCGGPFRQWKYADRRDKSIIEIAVGITTREETHLTWKTSMI